MKPHIHSDIHPVCKRSGAFYTGTVRWPSGHIFTEWPSTKGTSDVESGSSMIVFLLECISFHVPSLVQITPMKFVAVKSVPKIICLVMCLQTIKD